MTTPNQPPQENILVIRQGALGDCIHVLPSIQALKATYPNCRIHWLTATYLHPLLIPYVDSCLAFEKPKGLIRQGKWLIELANQCKQLGITKVINLHPSIKTTLLTKLISQPSATYKKEKLSVTGAVQREIARKHAIEDFYQPFKALFPSLPSQPSSPVLSTPDETVALDDSHCHIAVILGVGGKRPNRSWPMACWQQWATNLTDKYNGEKPLMLHLIGGGEEAKLANEFSDKTAHLSLSIQNHVGQTSLLGMVSLFNQCQLTIGGDTGPLHVAAASHCPNIIGLYAPTSVARTGPKSNQSVVTFMPNSQLTCWPCEKPTCTNSDYSDTSCMAAINVTEVTNTTLSLLCNQP